MLCRKVLTPGAALGPYQLLGELARGGMAVIYRASQPSLGRVVALKVLSTELATDQEFVDRFLREARIAAQLEHPHIVPIHDVGQVDGVFYIAMRLVPGESLARLSANEGPFPLNRALKILSQVASALDYAHAHNVVHRDIKPSNILIEPGDQASLADFGIARAADASHVTRVGAVVGTPQFMAPEQALGRDVDYRADLYSFGVVAYTLLTGRVPFEADSVVGVLHKHVYDPPPSVRLSRPDLPVSVDVALRRMLAKDPAARFDSAADFVAALQPAPTPRRRSVLLVSLASGLGAVLVLTSLSFVVRDHLPGTDLPVSAPTPAPTSQLPRPTATTPLTTPITTAPTPAAVRQLAGTWQILAGDSTAPGRFNQPTGLAVDAQGNIFVAEAFNHRIQKLAANGEPLQRWGTYGDAPGQFRDPAGVALDASGNVYVADRGNNRIQKLGPDGQPLAQWGGSTQLNAPVAVAVDAQGNVYVADSGNNRIQKFSATGQPIQKWGTFGDGPGQFTTPAGVAVDGHGDIYVSDQSNNRVQKLAADGRPLAQWGATATPDGTSPPPLTFSGPTGIVLDAAGNLLVTDSGANRVVKLSSSGAQLAEWGTWGDAPAEFQQPQGVAVDAQGNILVADRGNDRVQKLAPDGTPLTQWGSAETGPHEFRQPAGIAVDAHGNVYVADKNDQRIQQLSSSGGFLAQWGSAGEGPGQFGLPAGLAVDAQGNVLATDASNAHVQRFSPDGQLQASWGTRPQMYTPAGIAVNRGGDVYVVDSSGAKVLEFSADGQLISDWGKLGTGPGEFQYPVAVAVGPDGSIYVSDQGNFRIQKFSPTGQRIGAWGGTGSDHGQFLQVEGIAVDAQGNVFVADSGNNRISEFSANGELLAEAGVRGMRAGEFQGPTGIAVDATGAIYVTEVYNHRVQRFRPL